MSAEAEEVEANDTGGDTVESRELQEALGRAAKARAECHSLTNIDREIFAFNLIGSEVGKDFSVAGKPDEGEPHVRIDEGALEIGPSLLRQSSTLPFSKKRRGKIC